MTALTAGGRVAVDGALTGPHVIREADALWALGDEWRALAASAAQSPFESPDWLLPWFRHYGGEGEPFVLTWRRGGRLVALAPLLLTRRRRPVPLAELAFWGGAGPAISGLVDVIAWAGERDDVNQTFGAWLRSGEASWDLFHALRLPAGSPTREVVERACSDHRWVRVRLTGVVHSITQVIDLGAAPDGPDAAPDERGAGPGERARAGQAGSVLGPKARHNLRTEARRFAAWGGSYALLTDPAGAADVRSALERLSLARWVASDVHFGHGTRFGMFLDDVFPAMLRAGSMYVHVARAEREVVGCLVTFALAGHAVAVLTGRSTGNDLGRFSIGKHLFQASIEEAIRRGCRNYDFLWVGGYKEAFWHAHPRRLESLVVGRGPVGIAAVGYVAARRLLLPRLIARGRRHGIEGGGSAAAYGPAD